MDHVFHYKDADFGTLWVPPHLGIAQHAQNKPEEQNARRWPQAAVYGRWALQKGDCGSCGTDPAGRDGVCGNDCGDGYGFLWTHEAHKGQYGEEHASLAARADL